MAVNQPSGEADLAEDAEASSEQAGFAPEAPVSQIRLVTGEVLKAEQPKAEAPVPPAFAGRADHPVSRPNKWDELSAGLRQFNTGSYRGDA